MGKAESYLFTSAMHNFDSLLPQFRKAVKQTGVLHATLTYSLDLFKVYFFSHFIVTVKL